MKTSVIVLSRKDEDAPARVKQALERSLPNEPANFAIASPIKTVIGKDVHKPHTRLEGKTAAGYASSIPSPAGKPQILQLTDSQTLFFEGTAYMPRGKALLKEAASRGFEAPKHFVEKVEGDFAVAILGAEVILAARDPVGVQPLYYGETDDVLALASNRKALWTLGVKEPESFPPGNVAAVTESGFNFTPVKTLVYQKAQVVSLEEAALTLQELLKESVRIRVAGLRKVAVAFSGGLDSSVVAFLAHKLNVDVNLVHVSLENQPETEEAWKAAEALELPMKVHLFKESDLEQIVPQVVELVEEPDPAKVSIGIPFFWAAQKAAEAGLNVLLAGQGADELFGGYQRYVNQYLVEGEEKTRQTMYHDVVNVYENNLERDMKICSFYDVEMRLPFASYHMAKFALALPSCLKFETKPETLRKLVLRQAAENLGLPKAIAQKPKKAVQYSTGVSNALKRTAKKQNLTLGNYISKIYEKLNIQNHKSPES